MTLPQNVASDALDVVNTAVSQGLNTANLAMQQSFQFLQSGLNVANTAVQTYG